MPDTDRDLLGLGLAVHAGRPQPTLTICTLSTNERCNPWLLPLLASLQNQLGPEVEHLWFGDNGSIPCGTKANILVAAARGKYISFVDDDDEVAPNYVEAIVEAARHDPDVIVFDERMTRDGEFEGIVKWGIGLKPGFEHEEATYYRPAGHHRNAVRAEIRKRYKFPPKFRSWDWGTAREVGLELQTEQRIAAVLYHYRIRSDNHDHDEAQAGLREERDAAL